MTVTQLVTRYAVAGAWVFPGRTPDTPPDGYSPPTPSALLQPRIDYDTGVEPWVAGGASLTTVLPNMAIPGTSLTSDSRGSIVVTVANTHLYRLHLPTGYVQVKAANCLVEQCLIEGYNETTQTANKGLVDGNNAAATGMIVRDSTLIPAVPGAAWTGIMGHHWTLTRAKIRNTVDCLGAYPAAGHTSDPVIVLVDGCDGDEMAFISPDANHSGDAVPPGHLGKTHNDWFQIQGAPPGSSIEIRYSKMAAFLSHTVGDWQYSSTNKNALGGYNDKYPADQSTSGLMLTPNVSSIHNVNLHDCWGDGGQVFVNGIGCSAADGGITITNMKQGPSTVFPAQMYSVDAAVPGVTATGNVKTADGSTAPLVRS